VPGDPDSSPAPRPVIEPGDLAVVIASQLAGAERVWTVLLDNRVPNWQPQNERQHPA
jgi:hypothetical protein